MRQPTLCGLATLLTLLLLSGCGGNNTYNPTVIGGAAPGFTLTVAPDSRTVVPGQAVAYTATLTAVNGFASPVNLSVTGLPADTTATFDPASVTPTTGGAASTLTVTTSADGPPGPGDLIGTIRSRAATPPGTYTLTVSAAGGGVSREASVTLIVEPGIAVAVAPPTAAVPVGATQTFTASVVGTTNTAVTWSVQTGGAGGTISAEGVYTAPATPGTDTVVATSVADPTRQGTATVTVQAGNLEGDIQ